mmetsp:Transcript_19977/g.68803  ORF Transcript_19977/g.68803 Transcript_19977/m.68803 type:complete len:204 (-) Transcript_19977:282-893(-)
MGVRRRVRALMLGRLCKFHRGDGSRRPPTAVERSLRRRGAALPPLASHARAGAAAASSEARRAAADRRPRGAQDPRAPESRRVFAGPRRQALGPAGQDAHGSRRGRAGRRPRAGSGDPPCGPSGHARSRDAEARRPPQAARCPRHPRQQRPASAITGFARAAELPPPTGPPSRWRHVAQQPLRRRRRHRARRRRFNATATGRR